MYRVRRLKLSQDTQLEALTLASGELYSRTVVCFWRTVRKKNIWLKKSSMQRWQNSKGLHAHSADAVVESFYGALKSWRVRRKIDPKTKPPQKQRHFYRVQWKKSAIRLRDGQLILSNGRGNTSLVVPWKWGLPTLVELGWNGTGYELRAVYTTVATAKPLGTEVAGVDLGEIHLAVTHDGQECRIYNGRHLRSVRRYQNKKKGEISARLDVMKRGSRRWKRLRTRKGMILRKLDNQVRDILHKQTTKLVSTLHKRGVQTVVIGDVREIQKNLDYGKKANQKMHQWVHGKVRQMISYKSEGLGMAIKLQDESYTSQTCPACGELHKPSGREYRCKCGFKYHRDGVGSWNIRAKYLGNFGSAVVGPMACPIGVRYAF